MANKSTNIIKWQKWIDPFGGDLEETSWMDYENHTEGMHQALGGSTEDDFLDEDMEDRKEYQAKKNKSIKVIASPMGLIPYTEHTASGKIFNFWTGHTNFNLSKPVVDCIEQTKGVETLDIFTRYRFRVAIGKCFDEADTLSNINNSVYKLLEQAK